MRTALALAILIGTTLTAVADSDGGPVIVIPSRSGVPIMINGRDAAYAVVEGDWGLGKGVHVQPTIYQGWRRAYPLPDGHYFPSTGRRPGYGRQEVETPRRNLPQAESYRRSWSAESQPGVQPGAVPFDPPPVIPAPPMRRHQPIPGEGYPAPRS